MFFRNSTVITVAHRLVTVGDAELIVVLERGRVVEVGSAAVLLRKGGSRFREMGLGSSQSSIVSWEQQSSHAPAPLTKLPSLDFTIRSHLSIHRTTITTNVRLCSFQVTACWRSVLFSNPFTSGVVSITITNLLSPFETVSFGLMDSSSPIPKIGEGLGYNVKNSVGLNTDGTLWVNTPSSNLQCNCHSFLNEGDCVRIIVDLDSTPRTVQFFVNGEAGRRYVSGIPSSVRIGV
ncbi:hypothetical protein BLNAU_12823 [Blattamonas nauphoetae]|uniref:B30.2/SPRY domain-containing protein n=1 Tax=Blattamonas nauphoetae TaxID=2049346 RepID=A0ABQ9XKK5_9EUKA|nr:hypothetical protein BLNAU_12823 [Blattamonas nauphoetae]